MIRLLFALFIIALSACAPVRPIVTASVADLAQTETAFAQSMAKRDFAAFASFIDEDAVFINGGKPLRGRAEIMAHWKKHFVDAAAPFSWRPVITEISDRNGLGYTEGPVQLLSGEQIATFYSTWRLQPDGQWKIIFDNGYELCGCKSAH